MGKSAFFGLVLILTIALIHESYQASPFDGVNVDSVLRNRALVQRHVNCLMCKGPCDRIGSELRRVLPIVASNNCQHCSPQERANLGKIIDHTQRNYPQEWQEINANIRSGRKC